MNSKGRVLVAMSGGIDSSVAAMMLHDQGYEVIGMTMKTWDYESSGTQRKETGCCSLDSIQDARDVAVQNGFPHYILDIREEFGESIIDNFVNEYLAGRTPNPCVLCNTHIKWEALLKRADMLGCQYIATGHYAKLRYENQRYVVSKGRDASKDQTYVLWGLSQECLARTLWPLGTFLKSEIRDMAVSYGFEHLAKKSESYDICFIPDNDYRAFLNHRIPGLEKQLEGGSFIYKNNTVGRHRGYPFYTIGQRKGLEIAMGHPVYVTAIDPDQNRVYLGDASDLMDRFLKVRDLNLIKYRQLPDNFTARVKIRYKDPGAMATLHQINQQAEVVFHQPVSAIAPGQSAVFYEGDDLVGGGFIAPLDSKVIKS